MRQLLDQVGGWNFAWKLYITVKSQDNLKNEASSQQIGSHNEHDFKDEDDLENLDNFKNEDDLNNEVGGHGAPRQSAPIFKISKS